MFYEILRSNIFSVSLSDLPRPTDAELEILTVLWEREPSTVREVHEALVRRKTVQYSTVLKTLQIMNEKGIVNRDETERDHRYQASRPREWTQRQLVENLLQSAFANTVNTLIQVALSTQNLSKKIH